MPYLGKKAFVSYRGRDASLAADLARWLADSGVCAKAKFVPPGHLAVDRELLRPLEVFELMGFITDDTRGASAFVILDTGDYWDSYWTRTEVLQWRRFAKRPEAHIAREVPTGGFAIEQTVALEPMTAREKALWERISMSTNRRQVHASRVPKYLGRHARNCYLLPSAGCGAHFLATKKIVHSSLPSGQIRCPICETPVRLRELAKRGTFYRKPIVVEDDLGGVAPLDAAPLLDLLMSDDLPPGMRLVKAPDE
jgi:hypothetical protein